MRHELASPCRRDRPIGRCARRCRARPADLDRVPRALRKTRPISVRRLWRGGCDVRAGGASLPNLRDPSLAEVQAYMETMMALAAFREWTRAALAETLVI